MNASGSHEVDTYSRFDISIILSEKGLDQYDRVIEAVFLYAKMLKEKGPQQYLFEEIRDTGVMNF